jgi:triosephosphate isomerase
MPRTPLIVGNWKMHTNQAQAADLAAAVVRGLPANRTARVALAPPFPWLSLVGARIAGTGVELAAQNCHTEKEGAFTGEVSAPMIADAGCRSVIVGHSERRHGLGETDPVLNAKAKAGLSAGLTVIFCVGEQLAEREAGLTESVLDSQLAGGLAGLTDEQLGCVCIAYEPVWAIGTGKVATTEQAQAAHAFIRQKIATLFSEKAATELLILYGGSVKPENAEALLRQPDVDGALVGGASLKADQFLAIVAAAG